MQLRQNVQNLTSCQGCISCELFSNYYKIWPNVMAGSKVYVCQILTHSYQNWLRYSKNQLDIQFWITVLLLALENCSPHPAPFPFCTPSNCFVSSWQLGSHLFSTDFYSRERTALDCSRHPQLSAHAALVFWNSASDL